MGFAELCIACRYSKACYWLCGSPPPPPDDDDAPPRRGGNTQSTTEKPAPPVTTLKTKSSTRKALEAKIATSPSTRTRSRVPTPTARKDKLAVKKEVVTSEELQRQLWKSTQSREIARADAHSVASPLTRTTLGTGITSPTVRHEREARCHGGVPDMACGSEVGSPSATTFEDKVAWWAKVACQPSKDSIMPDLAATRTGSSNFAAVIIKNSSSCLKPLDCEPRACEPTSRGDRKNKNRSPARRRASDSDTDETLGEARTFGEVLSTVVDEADRFIKQYESEDTMVSEHPMRKSYSLDTRDRSAYSRSDTKDRSVYSRHFSTITENSNSRAEG